MKTMTAMLAAALLIAAVPAKADEADQLIEQARVVGESGDWLGAARTLGEAIRAMPTGDERRAVYIVACERLHGFAVMDAKRPAESREVVCPVK